MSTHDVIVIGAGVTGLTAAWRLSQAGADVLVLEARDRVGGRLRSERHDDALFEIGGQWIAPDQTALAGLVDELGLRTFPRYRTGESLFVDRTGVAQRFTGDVPLPARTAAEVDRLTRTLDALAAQMDPERPWELAGAHHLDSVTFSAWLEAQTDDRQAVETVALYIGPAMLTKPAYAFSALQAVLMAASAGSFSNLVDADVILDRRVDGGLAQVPLRLAARLGDRVRLEQDVHRVRWSDDSVDVHVGDDVHTAHRLVLALPPTHVRRIRFTPELPAEHRAACEHQSFGLVLKVQAHYATPFWRDCGLSGTGFGPYQLVHEVYDDTHHGHSGGTLVAFVSDVKVDALGRLPDAERQQQVLSSLACYFGGRALLPQTYVESDWQHQELTGGAYGTSFDVGGLTRWGPVLRQPLGALRLGSSDVAGHGFQHVDGAVRVGTQIASELVQGLPITAQEMSA